MPQQQYGAPPPGPYGQPMVPMSPEQDIQNNKLMAILSYLGILWFIPLINGDYKRSPFVKFHFNQGLLLIIFNVALGFIYGILVGVITAGIDPWDSSGRLMAVTLVGLIWLVPLGLIVYGVINAATGKFRGLPGVEKITLIK
ncbi:MAG: hypothetical protein LBH68_08370 [Bifidobacteriaceae bacterium]|jgi:hypothetical protein|nr:hypothetical protein [Bifidobacteriaceae bacterium]